MNKRKYKDENENPDHKMIDKRFKSNEEDIVLESYLNVQDEFDPKNEKDCNESEAEENYDDSEEDSMYGGTGGFGLRFFDSDEYQSDTSYNQHICINTKISSDEDEIVSDNKYTYEIQNGSGSKGQIECETKLTDKQIELIKQIKSLIKQTQASGQESVGGSAHELPVLPGLYVKDFGNVQLPLDVINGENLIEMATQAPYGLNEQTLIDTKVRDSFQIEPSSVELRNPEWDIQLKRLVERVAKGLGCNGKIESKLYKLLVYRMGGHFKKHKDTEKDKNMFATLVIQLPSIHEGGELVIHNKDGTTQTYDFGQSDGKAAYMSHFVAHYADVEHEILELKSGYRLALVYSLCWINGNGDNTINNCNLVAGLVQCLNELNTKNYQIALKLDHDYTSSSFRQNGIQALKGIDNDRFNLLQIANNRLPKEKQLNFYIANAELCVSLFSGFCTIRGDKDYMEKNDGKEKFDDWEEMQRDKHIREWYNVDGAPCFNNSKIKLNFMTNVIDPSNEELFSDMSKVVSYGKTRMVHRKGYTGNEGVNKSTIYDKYLLFFWPKQYEFDAFLKISEEHAIDVLHSSLKSDLHDSSFQKKFAKIISTFIEAKKEINRNLTVKIMEIFEKINDLNLLKSFLSNVSIIFHPLTLAKLIVIYSWDVLKSDLEKSLLPVSKENIYRNCELVQELFNLNNKEYALKCFNLAVLPILDKENNLKTPEKDSPTCRIKKDKSQQKDSIFHKLLETILLFELDNMNEFRIKYTKLVANEDVDGLIKVLNKLSESKSLISFIDYNCLFKMVSGILYPSSTKILFRNCEAVEILFHSDLIEPSYECFKQYVVPVLENAECIKSTESFCDKGSNWISDALVYYKLSKILLLFEQKNFEELRDKFTNLICTNKTFDRAMELIFNMLKGITNDKDGKESLFKIINFYNLFKKLFDKFDASKIQSLSDTCRIIKMLHKLNKKEIALECAQSIIISVMDKVETFKPEEKFSKPGNFVYLYMIADVIMMLEDETIVKQFTQFIKKLIEIEKSQKILKYLIDTFETKEEYFCKSASILDLYLIRHNSIKMLLTNDKPKKESKVSWSMPGSIEDHPKLNEFLQSQKKVFIYDGSFRSIEDAKKFVSTYNGFKDGYSVFMSAVMEKGIPQVNIYKTPVFHQFKAKVNESYVEEYKKIKKVLLEHKKINFEKFLDDKNN